MKSIDLRACVNDLALRALRAPRCLPRDGRRSRARGLGTMIQSPLMAIAAVGLIALGLCGCRALAERSPRAGTQMDAPDVPVFAADDEADHEADAAADADGALQATPAPVPCPRCAQPPPPKEALQLADAVFVGVVSSVVQNVAAAARYEVTFDVDRTWTTDHVGAVTLVDVPFEVWECGSKRPEVGQRWLVYAMREDDRLVLSHCDRSRAIASDDPEINALGSSCDPVSGISIALSPEVIHVGDVFTVTVASRGFLLMEVRISTDPEGLAEMDPACPNPCRTGGRARMQAVAPGEGTLRVGAFGEAIFCMKGNQGFVWAYPSAETALRVLPAGAGPTPSATPPGGTTPTPPTGTTPPVGDTPTPPAARIVLPHLDRPLGDPTSASDWPTPVP